MAHREGEAETLAVPVLGFGDNHLAATTPATSSTEQFQLNPSTARRSRLIPMLRIAGALRFCASSGHRLRQGTASEVQFDVQVVSISSAAPLFLGIALCLPLNFGFCVQAQEHSRAKTADQLLSGPCANNRMRNRSSTATRSGSVPLCSLMPLTIFRGIPIPMLSRYR